MGAVHRYSIQCVLPINLFNEKIYLFLWFWMVLVAIITCISTLSWFLRIVVYRDRHQYVRRYVNLAVKLKVSQFTRRRRPSPSVIANSHRPTRLSVLSCRRAVSTVSCILRFIYTLHGANLLVLRAGATADTSVFGLHIYMTKLRRITESLTEIN